MTENEAIKILDRTFGLLHQTKVTFEDVVEYRDAKNAAIKALEEVQEYRKLGTLEEVEQAVEKTKAKRPKMRHIKKYDGFNDGWCPCCGSYVQQNEYDKECCQKCAQKLDWSEIDG